MLPISAIAWISEETPSSQAEKSSLDVRTVICATLGNSFERTERGCDGKDEEGRTG